MTTIPRRPRTIYANPSRSARPKPEASGRERFWWYFMRLSGLALVVLALGHMFIMHVLVVIAGQEIDFAFVQSRWGTPFWRIYDLLLLVLAFVHGVNGTRVVVTDYVTNRTARSFVISALLVVAAIWLVLGIAVIAFFDPDATEAAMTAASAVAR